MRPLGEIVSVILVNLIGFWICDGALLERSPEERNGYPLQQSCLDNSVDREAWWASPWGPKESDMTEQLTYLFLIHR